MGTFLLILSYLICLQTKILYYRLFPIIINVVDFDHITIFNFNSFSESSALISVLLDMSDFSIRFSLVTLSNLFFKFFSFKTSWLFLMSSYRFVMLSITFKSYFKSLYMSMKNFYNSLKKTSSEY